MERVSMWMIRPTSPPHTSKTIACQRKKRVTHVTRTTRCSARSRQKCEDCTTFTSITSRLRRPRKTSNSTSRITIGNACICHEGARSFEQGAVHNADPDLLPAIKSNQRSCISSGCHEVVHNVATLGNVKFWNGSH